MKLTGAQIREIADISDGADVALTRPKGEKYVNVHRLEDGLKVKVYSEGLSEIIQEAENEC